MQMTYSTGINSGVEKKYYHQQELHLTPRDFDILKFILEMKFASLEDLARKFFWRPKDYPNGPTLFRTRDRLYKLQINKLITPERYPREKKNHFMVSWKGFYALDAERPNDEHCKPLSVPDYTNFEHDKLVLKSRLYLEERFGATDWISDRYLRQVAGLKSKSKNVQIPDGIYTNQETKRVAFELERSRKTKSDYAEIIRKYVHIIRSKDQKSNLFEAAHFVCLKDSVAELLRQQTKIYGDLFKIQTSTEFFGTSN